MARCSPEGKKFVISQHTFARSLLANKASRLKPRTWINLDPIAVLIDRPIEEPAEIAQEITSMRWCPALFDDAND